VDAAVNKIRAEVDPEAELIFGAIKDENMNGKIRVSIVATALHGSETKPYLNLVNNNSNSGNPLGKNHYQGDSLFSNNYNVDKSIVNSIDGATALKLDESYEIKSTEEQNTLIDNFQNNEESKIAEDSLSLDTFKDEIPTGVSIESASYIEKNEKSEEEEKTSHQSKPHMENIEEEYTPKLFSEDSEHQTSEEKDSFERENNSQLFDQDSNEDEDFEIPAFLRRQKF
tara:strand:- start:133 stop:813 length:681 start_codon:yes stop_codon:yes gene_type:complete